MTDTKATVNGLFSFIFYFISLKFDNISKYNDVKHNFNTAWSIILEPLLFISIGNQILFSKMNGNQIGLGIVSLLIGLVCRFIATFLSAQCSKFNRREQLFISLAWLPKATVQAAIGSLALDMVTKTHETKYTELATLVRAYQASYLLN